MQPFNSILNLVLESPIILVPHTFQNIAVIRLFGVPFIFVLKFFGELFLLFSISALISYILNIDKASKK